MMIAFVTGGSGFIGQYVVRKLVARGYTVRALARSESSVQVVERAGATAVWGDLNDRDSLIQGMTGCNVVYHIAAWYKVGDPDWTAAERINVAGTRQVLRLAYELEIPKIIYVSTIGVFGDTHGHLADENYYHEGPFLTEYERTKWIAHYRVALPLIEKGAPISIVMPGGVYGPGDHSLIGDLMRRFYYHRLPFPFVPGPETTLTYAHVEDVAEGIILAAEKGKIGESYILAGPAVPLDEMVAFWSQLTGKRMALIPIPAAWLKPAVPLVEAVQSVVPLPEVYSAEALRVMGTTFIGQADKARAELGWRPRSLQAGMLETLASVAAEEPPVAVAMRERERKVGVLVLFTAVFLLILWWWRRHK
jgi:dihydroflavonol-4-reductase